MKKILLPVDGSEACAAIYDHAKFFAEKLGAEILIINAQDKLPVGYAGVDFKHVGDDKLQNAGEAIVEQAKKHFEGAGLKTETRVLFGDAASVIIDTAESEQCDMIIICTHGMSAARRFLIGSVANKVVHHASVPVLVIR